MENGMRVESSGGDSGGVSVNGHLHTDNAGDQHGSAEKTTSRLSEAAQKYMQELLVERSKLENTFPLAVKLIDEALERIQLNGRIPAREQYADVYQQRTIKLTQKVHVPIKNKKFNYVGKLLGPKGNSVRRLQEETQCKIVILGRFSMKDRAREEELRNSADFKYAHLNLPLHVEVSTVAPPAEAYARMAYALAELRRYLIPDKHDDIRQEQFRELMEDPEAAKKITMRQQRQQQQQQHHHQQQQHQPAGRSGGGNGMGPHSSGGGGGGGGPNNNNNNNNNGRSKYQPQNQHYHHNDETVYYRPHNSYHQMKPYVPGNQRMHSAMPPPTATIVGASPTGPLPVVNAANYSGRGGPGMNPGPPIGLNPNIGYRASQMPSYKYTKK